MKKGYVDLGYSPCVKKERYDYTRGWAGQMANAVTARDRAELRSRAVSLMQRMEEAGIIGNDPVDPVPPPDPDPNEGLLEDEATETAGFNAAREEWIRSVYGVR